MKKDRPEQPLTKLARILGGVVLMHGRLGHQVLGQLLTFNITQPEMAGASLAVAAAAKRRNVVAQSAIGMAATGIAIQAMSNTADRRLTRREQALVAREQRLAKALAASGLSPSTSASLSPSTSASLSPSTSASLSPSTPAGHSPAAAPRGPAGAQPGAITVPDPKTQAEIRDLLEEKRRLDARIAALATSVETPVTPEPEPDAHG